MKVRVDVCTKDIDAALVAFKLAIENGATGVQVTSIENWDTKVFHYVNLTFDADHRADVISTLDDGPFVKDPDELKS